MSAHSSFKRPILSSIYLASGWCFAAFGILGAVACFLPAEADALEALPFALGSILLGFSALIGCLGSAQVIEYIGRSAYHLERIDVHLSSGAPSRTASSIARADAPRLTGLDSSATASCPSCMAELDVRTLHRGTNRCPSCQTTFVAE